MAIIILAFGFGNLAILGWLAAAAAPLLIHLWSRRQYQEVPWAAIEFLRVAMRKNVRRIQLQQWLLLAVRTLLIVAVVAALAEPFGKKMAAGGGTGVPTHHVFVLDRSFSMGYRSGNDTSFSQAQQLAIQKIKASGSGDGIGNGNGDGFSIVAMGEPPEVIVRGPSFDSSVAIKAVSDLSISEGGGNLQATLELIRDLLADSSGGAASFGRQEVSFLTDLGHTSWQDAQRDSAGSDSTTPVQQLIEQCAELASIVVLDVGTPNAENLAVVELVTESPVTTTAADVSFMGRLANFSPRARKNIQVRLLADGRSLATQSVDIPANGIATVHFTHRFKTLGDHSISLSLDDERIADHVNSDHLELDDMRWLVASVKDQLRVLCVAGKYGEANNVAQALDLSPGDPTSNSAFRATVFTDGQLSDTNLERYDCVVLCNVAQVTADETAQLRQHLRRGGGLIVFMGDRVLADQYNQHLTSAGASSGLIPVQLLEAVNTVQFGIDPLDYRHPIVQPFRGRERAGLLTTPVSRYFRLQIANNRSTAENVLALANGDPLVVAAPVEQGRALLVATAGSLVSIDPATGQPWSSMAAWPSFLPIVREMVNYAIAGNTMASSGQVGDPLSGLFSASVQKSVSMVRPDKRIEPIATTDNREKHGWVYEATDVSGIYRLGESEASPRLLAVNVDPAESDLARVDVDLLASQLTVQQGALLEQHESVAARQLPRHGAMAGNLLMAALSLALLEVGMAWMMGGGRR